MSNIKHSHLCVKRENGIHLFSPAEEDGRGGGGK